MPHFVMEGIKNIMEHVNKKFKKKLALLCLHIHLWFHFFSLKDPLLCIQVSNASLHWANLQARHLFLGGYTAVWSSRIWCREHHCSCQVDHFIQ